MKDKIKFLLKSTTFWASAVSLVAVVAKEAYQVQIDTDQILAFITFTMSFLVGKKTIQAAMFKKEPESE